MKNFKLKFALFISLLFLLPQAASACTGTYSVSVRQSATTITTGSYIDFTATFSSSSRFANWDATFSYDKNKLQFISGDTNLSQVFVMSPLKSKSYTYRFRAKTTGTASFTFKVNELANYDAVDFICASNSSASRSVKIAAPRELSSNNYLSNLIVEDNKISPEFNKKTLKYSLSLPEGTKTINVNASREDNYSSVAGLGLIDLVDGDNTINIIVTAENGSTRTYTISAYVPEPDPIIVKIDKTDYTLVRKEEELIKPSEEFIETTIKIKGKDIPALENKKLKIILIGLRDQNNKVNLYLYKDGKYEKFVLLNSKNLNLIIDENKAVKDYKKANLKIGDISYNVYSHGHYYYFYAQNMQTAEENLYRYDRIEGVAQIEIETEIETSYLDYAEYIIIALSSLLALTYLTLIIVKIAKYKKKKNLVNSSKDDSIDAVSSKKQSKNKKK